MKGTLSLKEVRQLDVAALTLAQVAAVLGVDRRTVARAVEVGDIPAVKFGRRVLIPREPFLEMFSGKKGQVA